MGQSPGMFLLLDRQGVIQFASAEMRQLAAGGEIKTTLVGTSLEADGPAAHAATRTRDAWPKQGTWRVAGETLGFTVAPFAISHTGHEWIATFQRPRREEHQTPQRIRDLSLEIAVAVLDNLPINVMYADADRTRAT
ncbi:MAG: hypothetical protein R3B96_18010 [Pirellulaceae bacterium]